MKPNLFLIHGWNMSPTVLLPLAQALSAQFSVTLAIMPGYSGPSLASDQNCDISFSGSPKQAKPTTNADNSSLEFITSAISDQAPPTAHWVGWSLGATVAMAAAIAGAKGLRSMSLISPSPCFLTRRDWDRGFEKQTFEKLLRVTNKKYELGTQLFLKLQSPSMPSQVFESVLNQLKLSQPTADGLQTGFESLCESDLRSRLTEITIPTQIISARTDDIIPPPASHYVSERLPNAICETIGNDHAIPISHHHELARSISNFFGELPK